MSRGRAGQSAVELTVLVAVTMMAVLGIQTYVRRGLQARLRATTDDLLLSPIGDSAAGEQIPDDGSLEPLGEPTQRRGASGGDLLQDVDVPCPTPPAVVPNGLSCTETAQDRDLTETYTAIDGAITKETTEIQETISANNQVFEELLGSAPAGPAAPSGGGPSSLVGALADTQQ